MDNREWFKNAGYGMMIHWGLYSLPAGEWKGRRMKDIGEWLQAYFRIPGKEYTELAKVFNPILFDADKWVRLARDAGMKYMVVTSKHHEGFAMFDSEWDDFNIVKGSPFGRDVIAEIAEACYKYGLKLGLYYSQELDWHEPDGGGYNVGHTNFGTTSWTNDWDYPDASQKDYSRCFEGKIKTQMKELLTKYGDLLLIWCDTPFVISDAQSKELYDMIKRYQPNCLVNSRIGNGLGDYGSTGDNETDFAEKKKNSPFSLFECPATLNDTWGYKSFDNNWKSAEKLNEIREKLNSNGINYLLNVGPDYLGRIPAPAEEILLKKF